MGEHILGVDVVALIHYNKEMQFHKTMQNFDMPSDYTTILHTC